MSAPQQWFTAQLKPNGLQMALRNLTRQGFATFAPMLPRTAGAPRPLFPGYLFVAFDPARPGWASINGTRGIARLLLSDPRRPLPLPAPLMDGLMARCDARGVLHEAPGTVQAGDRIRILSGPFADFVTTVEAVPERDRIEVLVGLLGRPVRASMDPGNIEKL